jgi:cytochrome P450
MISLCLLAACCALALAFKRFWLDFHFLSPLRKVPGPVRPSWIYGDMRHLIQFSNPIDAFLRYRAAFGGVVRLAGFWGSTRLLISDEAALRHILHRHSYDYPKPDSVRAEFALVVGEAILSAEGDVHKHQRRLSVERCTMASANIRY